MQASLDTRNLALSYIIVSSLILSYRILFDTKGQLITEMSGLPIGDAKKAFSHLKQVYSASGHSSKLELDYFEGEHEVDLAPAVRFFKENLQ